MSDTDNTDSQNSNDDTLGPLHGPFDSPSQNSFISSQASSVGSNFYPTGPNTGESWAETPFSDNDSSPGSAPQSQQSQDTGGKALNKYSGRNLDKVFSPPRKKDKTGNDDTAKILKITEKIKKTILNNSVEEQAKILQEYKNNNIIREESTLADIRVDEEYINITIQLEKEQEEEEGLMDSLKDDPCWLCDKIEGQYEIIYDESDNTWKKQHYICGIEDEKATTKAMVTSKGETGKEKKRLTQIAWEEMKSTCRHNEYFVNHYSDDELKNINKRGLAKSLSDIRQEEKDRLTEHVDRTKDKEDKDYFLHGISTMNTEWKNRRCWLCKMLLVMELRTGGGNVMEPTPKNLVERLQFMNGSYSISADVEHLKQMNNHIYFLFGQITPSKTKQIEAEIIERLSPKLKQDCKNNNISMQDLFTECINKIDERLMDPSFHPSDNHHIDEIRTILNKYTDPVNDSDILNIMILVLLCVNYEWSHSVCNRIKMNISFFIPKKDCEKNERWQLRPNLNAITQFIDELINGSKNLKQNDNGEYKIDLRGNVTWVSVAESMRLRKGSKGKRSKTSHNACFREDVIANYLTIIAQNNPGLDLALCIEEYKKELFNTISVRVQRICRIYNTEINSVYVADIIREIKRENPQWGKTTFNMYKYGGRGEVEANQKKHASTLLHAYPKSTGGDFYITLRHSLTGKDVVIYGITQDETILVVKQLLWAKIHISADMLELRTNPKDANTKLEDTDTLASKNIIKGQVIYFIVKARGGIMGGKRKKKKRIRKTKKKRKKRKRTKRRIRKKKTKKRRKRRKKTKRKGRKKR